MRAIEDKIDHLYLIFLIYLCLLPNGREFFDSNTYLYQVIMNNKTAGFCNSILLECYFIVGKYFPFFFVDGVIIYEI